jgi:hypothetical protein
VRGGGQRRDSRSATFGAASSQKRVGVDRPTEGVARIL